MKTITVELVKTRKITISCYKNDLVDIKCGGPEYLGFDFFVDADISIKKIEKFIINTLKKYNHPILSLHINKNKFRWIEKNNLWTFEKIENCIMNYKL